MKPDVYEYVRNYFQKNFAEYYLIFNEDGLPYAQRRYIDLFLYDISKKYDVLDIKNGNVADELKKILNDYTNNYFTVNQRKDCSTLYNYVKSLMVKRGINHKYSSDMFDHMVKLVVSRVWPQYDESRLNTEDFNHVIILMYYNEYKKIEMQINKKIEQLLDYSFDIFEFKNNGINKDALKEYVVQEILLNKGREFLNRLKSLVLDPNRELSRTGVETHRYIEEYIAKYSPKQTKTVDTTSKNNENSKEVRYSSAAQVMASVSNMKENSVQNEVVPKEIKMNKKQRKIAKYAVTLALIGTLIGGGVLINNFVEYINDTEAIVRVDALDGFDYSRRYRDDSYYKSMATNIISFYSKMDQLDNENYKTLGFYHAYKGFCEVNGDRTYYKLSEMNKVFEIIKDKLVENDGGLNLKNIVHADDEGIYCFLDFVYDRLADMGYNKVNYQSYQTALKAYKLAEFSNIYGVAADNVTDEELRLIEDALDKYLEYCEQCKLELGYLIPEGDYSFFPSYTEAGRSK